MSSSISFQAASVTVAAAATQQKAPRKSASLPPETVEYLKAWMMSPEHVAHPYPTEQEKAQIMAETGIELKQLTNWFVNNRKRYWKPMVEAKQASGEAVATTGGGLTIAVHHMNPNPQGSMASFPAHPNSAASSAPLYVAQSQAGPASPHDSGSGPANAVPADAVADREDETHTISDGSASFAGCNSDDDSIDASLSLGIPRIAAFGATSNQHLDRLAAAGGGANASAVSSSAAAGGIPRGTGYWRHEEVDIYVLRPEGSSAGSSNGAEANADDEPLPTLRDLTIKSSAPHDRVLATFKCPISYAVPYEIEHDRKKVQSCRDGEILRVKKHYLKLYLATRGIHSASSPVGSDDGRELSRRVTKSNGWPSSACSVSSNALPEASLVASVSAVQPVTVTPLAATSSPGSATSKTADGTPAASSRARAISCNDDTNPSPRKRACTTTEYFANGEEEWRSLCQNAKSLYCETLPSLEDAARMFGYSSQQS